jgi:hypothetical protein
MVLLAMVWAGFGVGAASGPAGTQPARPAAARPARATELTIVEQRQAEYGAEFGMVMICPSHKHGPVAEALKKCEFLAAQRGEQIASIWVCRSAQMETLRQFGQLVDRVVVNPFAMVELRRPPVGDAYWPKVQHAVLDSLRELRAAGGDRQMFACIDVKGEAGLFDRRQATYEELEWMALASLGTGYQGIVWRMEVDGASSPGRLRRLVANLLSNCGEMARSTAVTWVSAPEGQPVSALGSRSALFVVLLNPQYMEVKRETESKAALRLPLEVLECRGQVELTPPAGVRVLSASTLSGRPLVVNGSGGRVKIGYRFSGGGELLICTLGKSASGQ